MKVLLVYPQCPDTFWSFTHALKLVSKKAIMPPLGLLTIAPFLPDNEFEKKLRMGKDKVPKSIGICLSSDFEINGKTLKVIKEDYPELKF